MAASPRPPHGSWSELAPTRSAAAPCNPRADLAEVGHAARVGMARGLLGALEAPGVLRQIRQWLDVAG